MNMVSESPCILYIYSSIYSTHKLYIIYTRVIALIRKEAKNVHKNIQCTAVSVYKAATYYLYIIFYILSIRVYMH